jgi:cell division protein DivIC
MKLPRIFHSRLFLAVVLIVLLVVFGLELNQWQQRRKVDAEIKHLVEEQSALEQRNNALQQSLQYFSSDAYKEKLAREQLGLKKDGEIVINFPTEGVADSGKQKSEPANNPQKWWEYIFKKS